MLTNNKKSIFAKSIAMIMAVLMVLAVCLTGCADKEAQAAADSAQTTATEAKDAAAAVKKALEDHLASLDPVTLEKVNAEIDKALVDYAKAEALTDFVKKGELTELTNKLNDYVKTAELAAKVKEVVGAYVTPTQLTQVENTLKELINGKTDMAAVEAKITEKLNALDIGATDAELAAKATELTNAINAVDKKVNELDIQGKIQNALLDYATKKYVDDAIAANKYDDAALTARLAKLEEVVAAILASFFTEEELKDRADNLDLLNMAPAEITKHLNETWSINAWNVATVEVLKLIENVQQFLNTIYDPVEGVYTEANMAKINEKLDAVDLDPIFVNGVRTDKDAYVKMLTYTLLRLPNKKTLTAYQSAFEAANGIPNFKTEYEALLNTLFAIGHKETVSGKTYQVVTTVEKAQIEAFNAAYDAKITEYVAENAFAVSTGYDAFKALTAINVFENNGEKVAVDADTYKTGSGANEVVWTKTTKTIRPAGAFKATDKLPNTVAFDYENANTTAVTVTGKYGNAAQTVAVEATDAPAVYAALYTQMNECFAAIKNANDVFAQFCAQTIKANTATTLPELGAEGYFDAYLNALESYMCIPVDGYSHITIFLTQQVTEAMNAAIARNNCGDEAHEDAAEDLITYYDLYVAMCAKEYDVLFGLYKSYAVTLLANIKLDYMSVSWHLISTGFTAPAATGVNAISTTSDYMTDKVAKAVLDGTMSEGFIDAFLNGTTTTFTGWKDVTGKLDIQKSFKATALLNYYAKNGIAKNATGADINADPVATLIKYSAEDNDYNVRQYLNAATVAVGLKIDQLTVADAKAASATDASVVFVALLNQAVANLDEIYNRYLVEDYKNVLINTIYDEADFLAELYSNGQNDALTAVIEQYLTGTGVNSLEASLTNGALTTEMAKDAYKVNVEDKDVMNFSLDLDENGKVVTYNIATIGGKAMADAATAANGFLATMEELAIKDNFVVYLDTALENLTNAYLNYFAIAGLDYKMMTELSLWKNNYDTTISMIEFMVNKGQIVFGNYRENYANLLAIVATEAQDAHIEQLQTWGFDVKVYAEAKKVVKSSDTTKKFETTGPNKVYNAVDWTGATTDGYKYVGNAVATFDKIVNANAIYYTQATDGTWTVVNQLYPAN